jgi:MFS family permease
MPSRTKTSFAPALMLSLVYGISLMDRQVVSMLLEPIKQDLLLSDTQLALMSGLVFALFYGLMGIPIARMADTKNRVNIITVCLAVWSGMTVLSGMASNFITLLCARIGVGVGEAGCSPTAQSIIADLYKENRRGRALAIYTAGAPIGTAIAYVVGGWIAEHYGWRMALITAGIPGIICALAIKQRLREPPRKRSTMVEPSGESVPNEIRSLYRNRLYRLALWGHIYCIALIYIMAIWLPTLLIRSYGLSLSEVGILLATTTTAGSFIGTLASGFLADRLSLKDPRWLAWLPLLFSLISLPFLVMGLLTNNLIILTVSLTAVITLISAHTPPTYTLYHRAVSSRSRGMAVALSTLAVNILGLGLAPLFVGFISDSLTTQLGQNALQSAMLVSVILLPCAGFCYYRAAGLLGNQAPQANTSEQAPLSTT